MWEKRVERIIRYIFLVLLIFIGVFFVWCCLNLPSERLENRECNNLEAEWERILPDGSRVPIAVPGQCDAERGEEVIIATTLPTDIHEDAVLGLRTSKQDMVIYIGDEERMTYSTKDTRLFGKASLSIYISVPLTERDGGKEIRIHFSSDSSYAGVIRPVYYTTVFGLWNKVIRENVPMLFHAAFMIVFAVLGIIISVYLQIRTERRFYLEYLGWAVLIIAGWLVCQSPLRQLYFENISMAADFAHLMLLLVLFPVCIYVNNLQGDRYSKFYFAIAAAALADLIFCIVITVTGISSYPDVQNINLGLYGVMIVGVMINTWKDYRDAYLKEYKLTAYGFLGFVIGAVLEIAKSFRRDVIMNGEFICIGVVFMLIMAMIAAFREFVEIQQEDQKLKVEVSQKELKIEKLTYQAMETLAQTIDAKDTYTKGHSTRVAEYSKMIAKRLGKSEAEQAEIYFIGLLHDIGKIGIKDDIINKPGRLTEEEFAIIRSHSTIGFDILKSMTEIDNIEYGARWHHERYDGTGYPDGIKGEEIPEFARIIAVADAYDAMSSTRSYRNAMSQEEIRQEVIKGRGKQFDPVLADILLQLMEEDTDYNMRQKL